ncbi:Tim44 domain-containing protein [Paludibacterium sp.]|uniref:Tim44 domain-containing protein n=1 Tax=Paludibacterium sp. TaxID=1917523 RepID=UPI0025EBB784|nr:Tim44-like domain-containing protein [Paludibacterium sp.]MBV8645778.1 Tim44 domain-containing protein [Paludibacterium sp.]
MNSRAKTMILAFSLASLLLAPLAEAARIGKGRSAGVRRSAPTQPYQQSAAPAAPQPAPAQPQKQGPGIGTVVAAGAAGAAAGYMLGSATNHNAATAPAHAAASAPATASQATQAVNAPAPQPAGIPWHWVILLGVAFLIGLAWFRRRMAMPEHAPQAMRPQPQPQPQPQANDNRFDAIPAIGSGFPGNGGATANASTDHRRLPDGTEAPYFLRQAKAIFLHLQSLNSPDSLDEVARYMTPELFNELKGDIVNNQAMADFTDLDCQLIDAGEEMGRITASVRFFGLVSEEVNATPVPFSETWHFVKDDPISGKWKVAGIQQS